MTQPELEVKRTTKQSSGYPIMTTVETYTGEAYMNLRDMRRESIPPEVSLAFGNGYERVRKILAYTMTSPIARGIVRDFYTRETPVLTVRLSGTELGYTLADSIEFYDRIKGEIESFDIAVYVEIEEEEITGSQQLPRNISRCTFFLQDSDVKTIPFSQQTQSILKR